MFVYGVLLRNVAVVRKCKIKFTLMHMNREYAFFFITFYEHILRTRDIFEHGYFFLYFKSGILCQRYLRYNFQLLRAKK